MIDFYICPEMQKLRHELDKRNIKWRDATEKDIPGHWICRTHFDYKGLWWSVIHGFGTYGGFRLGGNDLQGLECMCSAINDGEPIGYLTADNILEYMGNIKEE